MDEPIPPSTKTSLLDLDPQRREKLADQTLARAISLGSAASKTALVWFVALALIWWSSFEPQMRNLNELTQSTQRLARIDADITSRRIFDETYGGQFENHQIRQADLKAEDDLKVDKTSASEKLQQSRTASATVAFKLPGFDQIQVPSPYAPLIWSILVLGLLIYVATCRKRMLTLCARAVRMYRELHVPSGNLAGIAAAMPWWIAPLPRRDSSFTRRDDLLRAFDWPLGGNRMEILNGVAFVLLLLLHLRMAWITFRTNELVGADVANWALTSAVFLSFGIALVVVIGWFLPIEVPDRFADEPTSRLVRKRDFVVGVAILALSCVAAPLLHFFRSRTTKQIVSQRHRILKVRRGKAITRPSEPPPNVTKNPRFRRKRHIARRMPSSLPMGFYVNNRSLIIHYVSSDREIAL